jgi:hypothetical protein
MNIDVYCDESQSDVFASKRDSARFLVIGSVWLEKSCTAALKHDIHLLRERHKIGPEFKWSKVSPSRLAFYDELISWFFGQGLELRFRCIVVAKDEVDLVRFHDSDAELGFYKFYYQLLHHWIDDFNDYRIFCDFKKDRISGRLQALGQCLDASNLTANVSGIQWVRSEESVLIQLADVLTGLVSSKYNGRVGPLGAKSKLAARVEKLLGREINHTASSEKKFNVFRIKPGGRW